MSASEQPAADSRESAGDVAVRRARRFRDDALPPLATALPVQQSMPQRREQIHARVLRQRRAARHELECHVVEELPTSSSRSDAGTPARRA